MSHYQGEDGDYMADEYDMEDVDEDIDEEFRGRESGASDSDVDDFDYSVTDILMLFSDYPTVYTFHKPFIIDDLGVEFNVFPFSGMYLTQHTLCYAE